MGVGFVLLVGILNVDNLLCVEVGEGRPELDSKLMRALTYLQKTSSDKTAHGVFHEFVHGAALAQAVIGEESLKVAAVLHERFYERSLMPVIVHAHYGKEVLSILEGYTVARGALHSKEVVSVPQDSLYLLVADCFLYLRHVMMVSKREYLLLLSRLEGFCARNLQNSSYFSSATEKELQEFRSYREEMLRYTGDFRLMESGYNNILHSYFVQARVFGLDSDVISFIGGLVKEFGPTREVVLDTNQFWFLLMRKNRNEIAALFDTA